MKIAPVFKSNPLSIFSKTNPSLNITSFDFINDTVSFGNKDDETPIEPGFKNEIVGDQIIQTFRKNGKLRYEIVLELQSGKTISHTEYDKDTGKKVSFSHYNLKTQNKSYTIKYDPNTGAKIGAMLYDIENGKPTNQYIYDPITENEKFHTAYDENGRKMFTEERDKTGEKIIFITKFDPETGKKTLEAVVDPKTDVVNLTTFFDDKEELFRVVQFDQHEREISSELFKNPEFPKGIIIRKEYPTSNLQDKDKNFLMKLIDPEVMKIVYSGEFKDGVCIVSKIYDTDTEFLQKEIRSLEDGGKVITEYENNKPKTVTFYDKEGNQIDEINY